MHKNTVFFLIVVYPGLSIEILFQIKSCLTIVMLTISSRIMKFELKPIDQSISIQMFLHHFIHFMHSKYPKTGGIVLRDVSFSYIQPSIAIWNAVRQYQESYITDLGLFGGNFM